MFLEIVLLLTISFVHASSDCIADASNILNGEQYGTETIDDQNKFENLYVQLKEQHDDQLRKLQNKYDALQERLLAYGENLQSSNTNYSCNMPEQKCNTSDNLELQLDEIYKMSSASNTQTNSLMEKVDKIEMLMKNLAIRQYTAPIQPPTNQLPQDQQFNKISRTKRTRGKYVGCFQDNDGYRLMKGYVKRMRLNHVELCVNLCRSGNFVYAGLGHEWCFCENTIHETQFNYILSDKSCDTPCKGNSSQMCGHSYVNSVYETGIEQYLVNEEGQQLPESYLPRSINNYFKYAGSGNFDD